MKNLTISYNGNTIEIEDGLTVTHFLTLKDYDEKRTSVWLDGRQLLNSEHDSTTLTEGCTVKVLRILGGG